MDKFKKINFLPSKSILNESMVVYEIENKISGNCYVGITTKKLQNRIYQHINLHSKNESSGKNNRTSLYLDFNKYGLHNFSVRILHKCNTKRELLNLEKQIVKNEKYLLYAQNGLKRDFTKKNYFTGVYLIDENNNKTLFKSPSEIAKKFGCHRSNVIKVIKGKYKLRRKYKVEYIY